MATRTPSLQNDNVVAINREIGSQYDNVKLVAENIDDVAIVAGATATTQIVADNMSNVTSVANAVVPNIAEILLANDNAATATAMATTATTQAVLANTARVAAETARGIAETKASEAAASAVAADASADMAAASAGAANTKAGEAAASATAAHNSELAAAAILDAFDDRYLGAFATNPTADNDGNALQSGAIYYNTVAHNLRVYDSSLVDWVSLSTITFAGMQDVALTSPTTGDVLKWNGTDWINTKEIALNSVQLLGGAGTQGTMTWNANEETVDIVQNGAVLQVGQEVQTHVRNNTASTINNGTVVMATGTIGASGRITVAPYDNVTDVKYVIGVVTENITTGDDGKVTHFGKVRGINTSAWNEGDVLYTTTAGGLTNVVPTSGKKLAVAFVVTKHAVNGTIMVRVSGVDELVYEPKNANIQSHIASTSNPHSVTKAQVGLGSVDNTADAAKNVLSATKLTTARAIQLSGAVTGTADFDGSAAINIVTTHTADPVITLAGDATGSVTLTNLGSGTLTVSVVDDSHNHVVDNVDGLRAELDAKAPLASPALTGTPTAPTATVGDSSTKLATTAFVNAEIANDAVPRITSIDNQLVRFNGTTGEIQGSGVVVDDNGNVTLSGTSGGDFGVIVKNNRTDSISAAASALFYTYDGTATSLVGRTMATASTWNYRGYGANSMSVIGDKGGGVNIMAISASGNIKFFTGGDASTNLRATIDSNGNLGLSVTPSVDTSLTTTGNIILENEYSLNEKVIGVANVPATSYRPDPGGNLVVKAGGAVAPFTQSFVGGNLRLSAGDGTNNYQAGSVVIESGINASSPSTTASGNIIFKTGNKTERMRITEDGKVSLGITSPKIKFQTGTYSGIFNGNGAAQQCFDASYNIYHSGGYKFVDAAGGQGQLLEMSQGITALYRTTNTPTTDAAATLAITAQWDGNGNMGLGVTPSAWQTEWKALELSGKTVITDSTASTYVGRNWYRNTSYQIVYKTSDFATMYEQNTGQHKWFTAPSGTAGNPITWTTAMTLNSFGNLLVGTATDNGVDKLQVNGGAEINGVIGKKIGVTLSGPYQSTTTVTLSLSEVSAYRISIQAYHSNAYTPAFYEGIINVRTSSVTTLTQTVLINGDSTVCNLQGNLPTLSGNVLTLKDCNAYNGGINYRISINKII